MPKIARVAGNGVAKLAAYSGRPIYAFGNCNQPSHRDRQLGSFRGQLAVRSCRDCRRRSDLRTGYRRPGSHRTAAGWKSSDGSTSPTARAYAIADGKEERARERTAADEPCRLSAADARGDAAGAAACSPIGSSHGKEHPVRLPERRGETKVARPTGPLIWIHGASVGEMMAALPLIERIKARGFARARHVRHDDLRQSGAPAPAAWRDPPVHPARYAGLCRALSQSLAAVARAVCRIRSVAEPDHRQQAARRAADPDQRPAVGALVQALAPHAAHHRGAAAALRPVPDALAVGRRTFQRTRRAAAFGRRQSQARRAAAAGRGKQADRAIRRPAGAPDARRRLDPSRAKKR